MPHPLQLWGLHESVNFRKIQPQGTRDIVEKPLVSELISTVEYDTSYKLPKPLNTQYVLKKLRILRNQVDIARLGCDFNVICIYLL